MFWSLTQNVNFSWWYLSWLWTWLILELGEIAIWNYISWIVKFHSCCIWIQNITHSEFWVWFEVSYPNMWSLIMSFICCHWRKNILCCETFLFLHKSICRAGSLNNMIPMFNPIIALSSNHNSPKRFLIIFFLVSISEEISPGSPSLKVIFMTLTIFWI